MIDGFGLTFEDSQTVLICVLEKKLSLAVMKALTQELDLAKHSNGVVFTVPPGMDVKCVARLMVAQQLRRLAVLESDRLVGLITMNDIVGEVLAMAEKAHVED